MAFPFFGRLFASRQTGEPQYPNAQRIPFIRQTLAGVTITPDSVVTVATAWACLRYLSQSIGALPWHVMRPAGAGAEPALSHQVDWLLYKRPNPEWSAFQFRETLTHWALRWGNGYAEIERDAIGRPLALWPIHPERVQPLRDETGKLFYRVFNLFSSFLGTGSMDVSGAGGYIDLDAADMFHVRGFGEGPVGVNVVQYAAESIGWAKAAQLFGAAFFGNGMTNSVVLTSDKPFDKEGVTVKRLRAMLRRLYRGPRKAHEPILLDNGMKIETVAIEPEKGQFLGTNLYLVEEVCRWFGVPPHKVAHLERATFSNIEEQNIEVVVDSLTPWCKRFEDEADYKLFGANRPGFFTKINLNALMRGNSAARSAFYKDMVSIGAFAPNDVLSLEDMPGIGPEGDKHVMQSQWTTLEMIGKAPVTPPSPPSTASPANSLRLEERAAQIAIERMAASVEMAA